MIYQTQNQDIALLAILRTINFTTENYFLTLVMDSPRLRDEFVIAILEDSTPLMNLE